MTCFARKQLLQSMAMALGAMVLAGCQTYNQQNKFADVYRHGDLANAEKEAAKKAADTQNSKDAVIWRLEEAAILRAANKLEASNKSFDAAEQRIDQYAQEAKVKVGSEAGALLSNQANLPYRGRSYDGIMANTYKALNYLTLGEIDKARVEITRAYIRQQDAVEENKKRIEKTQADLDAAKEKERIEKARQDEKFKGQMAGAYADLDKLSTYADYVNPFTVYLEGLYYMHCSTGLSDLEKARQALQRVSAYVPNNKFVKADQEATEALAQGKEIPPTTYVIFETGRAPIREQIRIDIPIIVVNVSYVGAAFPTFKPQDDYLPNLVVTGTGVSASTELIASMDSVIGHDFKNELPSIITKTMASTIAKAAAGYAANAAASNADSTLGLFVRIATAATQAAMNIADERTWTTLPKEFHVCRVPTPADRKLELQGGGGLRSSVTVNDGSINVVYVKSISSSSPLLVTQMKLK